MTAGSRDILLRRSSDGGLSFPDPPINLSANTGASDLPDAVARSSGSVRTAWIDDSSGTPNVFYRDSLDGGTTFRPAINISSLPVGTSAVEASVTEDSAGMPFVAWTEDDGVSGAVRIAGSADGGLTFGAPLQVHSPLVGFLVHLALATRLGDPDGDPGELTLAWNEVDSRTSATRSEVFHSATGNGGATWSAPVRLGAGSVLEGLTGVDLRECTNYGANSATYLAYWVRWSDVLFDRQEPGGDGKIFLARLMDRAGDEPEMFEMSETTGDRAYGLRDRVRRAFREPSGGKQAVWAGDEGIWFGDCEACSNARAW
jgi:hypothetical protein